MSRTIIIIPSRMSASRLPGKPLLEINKLPIISHVVKRAEETGIGDVFVATENKEILNVVEKNGGKGIITGSHHKTGTDRIFEAFKNLKIKDVDYIINLQGDEPSINKDDIINLNNLVLKNNLDMATLGLEIKDDSIFTKENIVKVVTKNKLESNKFSRALNFSRKKIAEKNLNIYHHIGIYQYKVSVLNKFINLSQTKNEIQNKLEQLRALDNNIKIEVVLAKSPVIGVDTKEDFLAIKKIMEYKS